MTLYQLILVACCSTVPNQVLKKGLCVIIQAYLHHRPSYDVCRITNFHQSIPKLSINSHCKSESSNFHSKTCHPSGIPQPSAHWVQYRVINLVWQKVSSFYSKAIDCFIINEVFLWNIYVDILFYVRYVLTKSVYNLKNKQDESNLLFEKSRIFCKLINPQLCFSLLFQNKLIKNEIY